MLNITNTKTIEKYKGSSKSINKLFMILFIMALIVFLLEKSYHIGYYIGSKLLSLL